MTVNAKSNNDTSTSQHATITRLNKEK
jgi:hypothetical protein